jgi:hypothetical protein
MQHQVRPHVNEEERSFLVSLAGCIGLSRILWFDRCPVQRRIVSHPEAVVAYPRDTGWRCKIPHREERLRGEKPGREKEVTSSQVKIDKRSTFGAVTVGWFLNSNGW